LSVNAVRGSSEHVVSRRTLMIAWKSCGFERTARDP